MPEAGCRIIANTFNRRFAENRQVTVSKTFVNDAFIKNQAYEYVTFVSVLEYREGLIYVSSLSLVPDRSESIPL